MLHQILHSFLGQAHSSVERAGLLGGVKFRQLEVDDKYKLRGDTFAEAIKKDKEQGFIPFYVSPAYPIFLYRSNAPLLLFLKKNQIENRREKNSLYSVKM